jgi:hypothetical protein
LTAEVVAVAAGLFEDISRDDLLALDLVFEDGDPRLEFFDVRGHCRTVPLLPRSSLAQSAGIATNSIHASGIPVRLA